MNNRQSGNEILEEARKMPEALDRVLFDIWEKVIRKAVASHNKSMDDKIFILDEYGTEFIIDSDMIVDTDSDAYDRAMKGI